MKPHLQFCHHKIIIAWCCTSTHIFGSTIPLPKIDVKKLKANKDKKKESNDGMSSVIYGTNYSLIIIEKIFIIFEICHCVCFKDFCLLLKTWVVSLSNYGCFFLIYMFSWTYSTRILWRANERIFFTVWRCKFKPSRSLFFISYMIVASLSLSFQLLGCFNNSAHYEFCDLVSIHSFELL